MTYSIINPEDLGAPKGFNHGMLAEVGGRTLFVAGMTACDASGEIGEMSFAGQFEKALANVLTVVREAGGEPSDVGRMTIYVVDISAYKSSRKELGEAYRRLMGNHYPAMTLVEVNALVDPEALVEIETTAVLS